MVDPHATSGPGAGPPVNPAASEPPLRPPVLAPWTLTGQALVFLLAARAREHAAPGLAGRLSAVALVDYATSPVGPYRELLHIPRVVRWPGAIGATVRDIWVDSEASAVNGNRNWGLTKSVIDFERLPAPRGAERWTATDQGTSLADVSYRALGPPLPVAKPGAVGVLVQRRDRELFRTPVSLLGLARFVRIDQAAFDPEVVVDLRKHRIVAALEVIRGRLVFEAPSITPIN